MKPIGDKILVSVNLTQKSDADVVTGGGLRLYMNLNFGHDQKHVAPNTATVVNPGRYDDLIPGDKVICHHNSFNRPLRNDKLWELFGDTGVKIGGESVFALEYGMVQCRIVDGNPMPLRGYVLVNRIDKPVETFLDVPDTARGTHKNQFEVVSVGPGCDGIEPGMTIVTYEKSDVTIEYIHDNKQFTAVRVKYDDILAINEMA